MKLVASLELLRLAEKALSEIAAARGLTVATEWDAELDCWKVRFWQDERTTPKQST